VDASALAHLGAERAWPNSGHQELGHPSCISSVCGHKRDENHVTYGDSWQPARAIRLRTVLSCQGPAPSATNAVVISRNVIPSSGPLVAHSTAANGFHTYSTDRQGASGLGLEAQRAEMAAGYWGSSAATVAPGPQWSKLMPGISPAGEQIGG
jgi:hypothetical protein